MQYGVDLFTRHGEFLHDLFHGQASFQILEHGGNWHAGIFEYPRAAYFEGNAFYCGTFGPIKSCRGLPSFHGSPSASQAIRDHHALLSQIGLVDAATSRVLRARLDNAACALNLDHIALGERDHAYDLDQAYAAAKRQRVQLSNQPPTYFLLLL